MTNNKLTILYNQTLNSKSGETFIYNLFNYLEFIVNDPQLMHIAESQVAAQEKVDLTKLNQLREAVLSDSKSIVKKIKTELKKIKDVRDDISKAILDYDNFLSGNLTISGDHTKNIIELTRVIFARMIDCDETKMFANKYAKYNKDQILVDWQWSPSVTLFEVEKAKVDRLAPTKIWFSWHSHLFLFHQLFSRYEEIWDEEYKNNGAFAVYSVASAMKEIKNIINDAPADTYYYFSRQEFEHHLAQFHKVFDFPNTSSLSIPSELNPKASFKDNTLTIGNSKPIKFRNNTRRSLLISFLFEPERMHKEWDREEWLESVDGIGEVDYKKLRSRHFSACEGVQNLIIKHTGIKDFLVFTTQVVSLNPKYI